MATRPPICRPSSRSSQADLQRSQGLSLQPPLVGPPQPLGFRPAGQHEQAAAAMAAGQGHGLVEGGLVIEAQLTLQGQRDGDVARHRCCGDRPSLAGAELPARKA